MTDPGLFADSSIVSKGRIHADEAVVTEVAPSGHHHMRCDETVVSDSGMMANVISTPHHYIVADSNERLDRVVLKNKTMLPERDVVPNKSTRTNIARQLIIFLFHLRANRLPQTVQFSINNSDVDGVLLGRKVLVQFFKWNNGEVKEGSTILISPIDGKPNDLVW